MTITKPTPPDHACSFCRSADWQFNAAFDARPDGETDFAIEDYYRELWTCGGCGHVVNHHRMDLSRIYDQDYWDNTYGDSIMATYEKIMGLPPEKSDNRQRVKALNAYWDQVGSDLPKTLLDIGAGLAVFPAAMRQAGWACTALDPDRRAAAHAEEVAGVEGLCADFLTDRIDRAFSLVTLNKVLEHVPDMVGMLAKVHNVLAPGGYVYLELPDAEGAMADSPAREEFFIEHLCAFSASSLALLAHQSGFQCDHLERLVEPSGKYTLRAFLRSGRK